MKELKITRKFEYNGIGLTDPGSSLSPDAVREFYSTQFPELTNAVVEGPFTKDSVSTFKFVRAAGAKGARKGPCTDDAVRSNVLRLAADGRGDTHQVAAAAPTRGAELLLGMTKSKEMARPLHQPSDAFGIWG